MDDPMILFCVGLILAFLLWVATMICQSVAERVEAEVRHLRVRQSIMRMLHTPMHGKLRPWL